MRSRDTAPNDALRLIRQVHEHLPDGFMLFRSVRDASGAVVDFEWRYTNPAAEKIVGRSHEELLGRRLTVELPGNKESGLFDRYVRVVETGEPDAHTFHYDHDGLDRWFSNRSVKVDDGFGVSFRDITESRRLKREREEERERLNALFMQAPVAISVVTPPDFRFELANARYEEMVGRPVPPGKSLREVFPELAEDAPVIQMLEGVYTSRETFVATEYKVPLDRHGDGTLEDCYFMFSCQPVINGEDRVIALQTVAVDITAQVTARVEIEALANRLRESEERLRAAQQAGRVGIFDWGVQGGEVIWTEQLERLFGMQPGAFDRTYESWAGLLVPEDRERFEKLVAQTWKARQRDLAYHYRFYRDDEVRWMEARARCDYDQDGRPTRVVGTNVDVTERIRAANALQASERQVRAIVENAGVGIAHVGLDGRWVYFNERLCQLTGYPAEELRELTFQDITHPADLSDDVRQAEALAAGRISGYQMEKRYIRRDGEMVWINLTVSLVRNGEGAPDYYVAIIEDISERKRAEAALKEANRQKDEFLAVLGHELRNPLAAIRMASEVIERSDTVETNLQRVQAVLKRQTAHMSRLLDDLLDVSRISRGKLLLSREHLDLVELVRHAVEDRTLAAQELGVGLSMNLPDQPVMVDGDPVRLAQVAGNLLDNALKYTDRGGSITVRLTADDHRVNLAVRDTGVGVEPAFQRRLFQPFQQAPQDFARSQGGLGLGLALTRGIARLHGGDVAVHSLGRDQGSVFTVTLPRHLGATEVDEAVVPDQRAGQSILLVEDNIDAAQLLQELLQSLGHDVTHVATGGEAVPAARRIHPDAVICDLGLPDMSGYDVARNLRELDFMHGKRIIALSGYGQSGDREKSARAGFAQHLIKPASLDDIHRALEGD